jgi:hypothetical protein
MQKRFAMTFDRASTFSVPQQMNNNIVQNLSSARPSAALNTPMIDRVHKARPGCSACGKKVM